MGGIPKRDRHPADPIPGNGGGYTHVPSEADPISPIHPHEQAGSIHTLEQPGSVHPQEQTGPITGEGMYRGDAKPGSHAGVFGLTRDGRRFDTNAPPPASHDSSVTNLTADNGGNPSGHSPYYPPRGTAVRYDSAAAPESVSGNVERIPTVRHNEPATNQYSEPGADRYSEPGANRYAEPGTNQYAAMSGEEFIEPEDGPRRGGTFSKIFKRKPVGGGVEQVGEVDNSGRKKYF